MLALFRVMLENPYDRYYGFELMEKARLKSGTLYPLLNRLEGENLLESDWEEIDSREEKRPRRRYYKLSGLGIRVVTRELEIRQIIPTQTTLSLGN
jgi:PadR family transcriptional regulator, regulatory protein PadR